MTENWREFLYPLGFIAQLAFTSRIILQWVTSEMKKESVVSPNFWRLSLVGNLILAVHSGIQIQYHVCVVQACNAVISWRNLNLMKPVRDQARLGSVIFMMVLALTGTSFVFLGQEGWFRIPSNAEVHEFWHLMGFLGVILFSSRFWLQWWCAEKQHESYLGPAFWWSSLVGTLVSLVYFAHIKDSVNFVGYVFGLIPYTRNLMLINKARKLARL